MSCPADSLRTFLKLARVPTDIERNNLAVNAYPFTISFGPSTVIPTFNKNMITDTQSDTLLYRGNRYQLSNIQICQSTHPNYTNKPTTADIALTYINKAVGDTYPSVILAIFPIYLGSIPDHNTYLQQFIENDSKATSAQTLFYNNDKDTTATCYSYKTCIQLRNNEKLSQTLVFNTAVHYFPRGTTLLPDKLVTLGNFIANRNPNQPNYGIMPFEFLPFQRGNYSTYLAANQWDPKGGIPTQQVSPTDDVFTKRVQYMTQPPFRSGNEQDACPYKKVSDYKCYPFSELNNITKDASGNQVVIPLGDAMKDPQKGSQEGSNSNLSYVILYIVVPIIIIAGIIAIVGVALFFTNQMSNPGFPDTAGSAAGGLGARFARRVAGNGAGTNIEMAPMRAPTTA